MSSAVRISTAADVGIVVTVLADMLVKDHMDATAAGNRHINISLF
jgi:hypothetical protein